MIMINDITTTITTRICSVNHNNHMHIQGFNHHATYSTSEDHTVTCPIPRTQPFEWILNSTELVHFTHKSEPLNMARTWATSIHGLSWLITHQPINQTTLGLQTNHLIPLDGTEISTRISLCPAHTGSSGCTNQD
jgi:hypothetical protein